MCLSHFCVVIIIKLITYICIIHLYTSVYSYPYREQCLISISLSVCLMWDMVGKPECRANSAQIIFWCFPSFKFFALCLLCKHQTSPFAAANCHIFYSRGIQFTHQGILTAGGVLEIIPCVYMPSAVCTHKGTQVLTNVNEVRFQVGFFSHKRHRKQFGIGAHTKGWRWRIFVEASFTVILVIGYCGL